MTEAEVDIGRYTYRRDGARWIRSTRSTRLVPQAMVLDASDTFRLGASLPSCPFWEYVFVRPDGIGVAAGSVGTLGQLFDGYASILFQERNVRFWRTCNHGKTWNRIRPRLSPWDRLRCTFSCWPPEQLDAISCDEEGRIAFEWEDPWTFERPDRHRCVWEAGHLWTSYKRNPANKLVPSLSCGLLQLYAKNLDDRVHWPEKPRGLKVGDHFYQVERMPGKQLQALIVAWKKAGASSDCRVCLIESSNNGAQWRVIEHFPGPSDGNDVNERGSIQLRCIPA